MNDYPWRAYNHGLEGQEVSPCPYTSEYNLMSIAERLGVSCADFSEIYDYILAWNIAVHGRG